MKKGFKVVLLVLFMVGGLGAGIASAATTAEINGACGAEPTKPNPKNYSSSSLDQDRLTEAQFDFAEADTAWRKCAGAYAQAHPTVQTAPKPVDSPISVPVINVAPTPAIAPKTTPTPVSAPSGTYTGKTITELPAGETLGSSQVIIPTGEITDLAQDVERSRDISAWALAFGICSLIISGFVMIQLFRKY